MGYGYKEEILLDIGPEPNCNYESESENYYSKIRELEKVYAMAERVSKYLKDLDFLECNLNECLTKAEAFDAICKAHVPLEKRMSPVTVDGGLDFAVETEKIILKYYESGEYNV